MVEVNTYQTIDAKIIEEINNVEASLIASYPKQLEQVNQLMDHVVEAFDGQDIPEQFGEVLVRLAGSKISDAKLNSVDELPSNKMYKEAVLDLVTNLDIALPLVDFNNDNDEKVKIGGILDIGQELDVGSQVAIRKERLEKINETQSQHDSYQGLR